MAESTTDGPDTDPATFGDAELLRRIQDSGDRALLAELRRRHLHGLTTIAAGYARTGGATGRGPDAVAADDPTRDDPETVVDAVLVGVATLPEPSFDSDVFLQLCARVRSHYVGSTTPEGSPQGLVDLVDGARSDDAAIDGDVVESYGSLDERDRVLLWFVATEGALPVHLARRLSIGGGDLAATMIHRARSALRAAYAERRQHAEEATAECSAAIGTLVAIADGTSPDPVHWAHMDGCAHCQRLLTELHALPSQLTTAISARTADDSAYVAGAADAAARGPLGPLVISTTPALTDPDRTPEPTVAVVAGTGAGAGVPIDAEPDEDDDDPRGRQRGVVIGIVAVFAMVAIAVAAWALTGRSSTDPVDATFDPGGASSLPVTTVTTIASTTTSSSSTSTSTTTSTTTTPPARQRPPQTPSPTPVPTAAAPVWVPPASQPPATPAPTAPPTTVPPSTQPPTTPAPTDPDPTTPGTGSTDP